MQSRAGRASAGIQSTFTSSVNAASSFMYGYMVRGLCQDTLGLKKRASRPIILVGRL